MCSVEDWEFNCPQFVDFEAGLETSITETWLEKEDDHQKAITALSKAIRPRMATPKVTKKSPFPKVPNVKTDDEKIASISRLPHRLSKSETCLNRVVEAWKTPKARQQNRAPKFNRKRSLSENNIKKKLCAVTPMCLKRTLKKTKTKGKTTEEIEMDKIAELQNKLKQQLKLNEVNLRRMKSNKAPYPAQKVLTLKTKVKAKTGVEARDGNQPLRPKGLQNRKMMFQCETIEKVQSSKENRAEALSIKSKKLQSVLDTVFKKSEVAPNVLRVVNGNNKGQYKKKYNEYCGLKFVTHEEKTVPQPFSFDTSSVSSQNASFCFKDIKADSFALKTTKTVEGKENVFRPVLHRKERI